MNCYESRMSTEPWRERLRAAIAARISDGTESYSSLARKAKRGLNFFQQYVRTDRDPSVENLLVLCHWLEVSPVYILLGLDVTPEEEEFLLLVSRLSPSGRGHLKKVLEELSEP